MAIKRRLENAEGPSEAKKPRRGFKVGPDNLPDGPWRRKVTKIKEGLIQKAKVKKAYKKVKAEAAKEAEEKQRKPKGADTLHRQQPAEGTGEAPVADGGPEPAEPQGREPEVLHPTRQLMLKDEEAAQTGAASGEQGASDGSRRRTRRPGYYEKQLDKAEQQRLEKEAKAKEFQRRQDERQHKIEERQRYKRAIAKTIGRDGKKKLGRESHLVLDKVKRMVGEK